MSAYPLSTSLLRRRVVRSPEKGARSSPQVCQFPHPRVENKHTNAQFELHAGGHMLKRMPYHMVKHMTCHMAGAMGCRFFRKRSLLSRFKV